MKIQTIACALLLAQLAGAQQTFHGDNARSGVFDSPSVRTLPKVLWKFKTEGPVFSSPAIANGVVYVGSLDSFLYAVDRNTGAQKWKFETHGPICSSPAVANGVVYFGSYDGFIYGVEADTGKLRWKFETENEKKREMTVAAGSGSVEQTIPDSRDFFTSSPAVQDGSVFIGSGDGHIYAIDADKGTLKWKFSTQDVVHASPALANHLVYVGSWDTRLYALESDTGKPKWVFQSLDDPAEKVLVGFQSSPSVAGNVLYVGCRDAHVYALDALSGQKLWEHPTDGLWVSNTPAVLGDTVYAGTNPLQALDAKTGAVRFKIGGSINGGSSSGGRLNGVFSSPAITGDTAYVGGFIGSLFAFDTKTGAILWEFKTDAELADPFKVLDAEGNFNPKAFPIVYGDFEDEYVMVAKRLALGAVLSSPVVDQGVIYFGSADGNLYALK